ncbi:MULTISPECIES: DUF3203 family protein [unclassified Pseudomonas]|jgi:hypothetical protein|uniref:DUF3203 family protein n=1 Tax=unclassified Pseudomonas TaxID=196821 RepID=UPI000EA9C56C|nr:MULTISPECIES: DUF3203 family protein [unclassified Pseudomonas]AYF90001.1 DUF3203 family protein [Pseudomonas sp. DY-1]MDH4652087.1 DUF3203 family protein [Pseudomonas sp. BN606]MRK22557.1 DUF3203 family protein [Pseudomonas sp. JG-B]
MTVSIDLDRDLCSLELNGKLIELPINQVVVRTDEVMCASVIRCVEGNAVISEDQAQMLIGAGAKDDRKHLFVDGGNGPGEH